MIDYTRYKERLCVALDVASIAEAENIAGVLSGFVGTFKVGSELFTSEGTNIVKIIQGLGGEVFLDLKYHDIPNTVAGASRSAVRLGVKIFNIHAVGGPDMMTAAVEANRDESDRLGVRRPLLLAVTLLTSIDSNTLSEHLGIKVGTAEFVRHMATTAQRCGLDGVICSADEVKSLRKLCGKDFILLTPGIRPQWAAAKQDQKRVATPSYAIRNGSDIIVVGRPILKAENPQQAAEKVLKELSEIGA